jgi:hypothetical protein
MPPQLKSGLNNDRTVVSLGDSFYLLTEVLELARRTRIEKVETVSLDLEDSRAIPSMPRSVETDSVVHTKFGGKLVVLAGKEIVRAALDKGVEKVPGRFVSPYALKQAKR